MFMLCVSSWNSQGRAHVGKHFVQHLKVGDCEKMANDIIRQLVVAPLRHLVLKFLWLTDTTKQTPNTTQSWLFSRDFSLTTNIQVIETWGQPLIIMREAGSNSHLGKQATIFKYQKRNIAKRVCKALVRFMKGHRSTEQLFTVKSVIAYYAMIEQPLITQNIDISKFFDKENLRDAMNTLYEAGVKGKPYWLWYKLNQNTWIAVKTGVSVT